MTTVANDTDNNDQAAFGRVPPQDINAEQSVLGGMLLSRDVISDIVRVLKPGDFYRGTHETIYRAILDLDTRDEPVDPITVADELTKRGEIGKIGGPGYLHSLVQVVPTAANAEWYAEIVHEKAVLRRLGEAGRRIQDMSYAAEGELSEICNVAQSEVYAATEVVAASDDPEKPGDGPLEAMFDELHRIEENKGNLTGVPTGLKDLDSLTQGLQPGQFVIIAARPSVGKSTLAMDIARHCSIKRGLPSLFFSLEMRKSELLMRMMCAEARVGLHKMRSGSLTEEDWKQLAKFSPSVSEAPLYIDDSSNETIMTIWAKARRQKARTGLSLVVVDYIQLLEPDSRRPENRQQEVSDISRKLKLMAKELDVPVVALSQLNRGPEQRTDKKPVVSDLRESGSLEQDADMVILLYREDVHDKESPRAGEADLIVGKHRNGPTATISVAFQGHYCRFVDMAQT